MIPHFLVVAIIDHCQLKRRLFEEKKLFITNLTRTLIAESVVVVLFIENRWNSRLNDFTLSSLRNFVPTVSHDTVSFFEFFPSPFLLSSLRILHKPHSIKLRPVRARSSGTQQSSPNEYLFKKKKQISVHNHLKFRPVRY